MENKSKVLMIGLGACGSNITDVLDSRGYESMAFNTATSDLDKLKMKEKHRIGDTEGSGKNPKISEKVFSENLDLIREKIKSFTKLSKKELCFIFSSTGGGSGRGSVFIVSDLVKELGMKPIIVSISPFDNEGGSNKINDFTFLAEFEKRKNELDCIMFENQVGDKVASKEKINDYISDCIDDIINQGSKSNDVFDFMDLNNRFRGGYAMLEGSSGTNVKLVSKRLDTSYSKYATLIKVAPSIEDGYGLLNNIGLGKLDMSYCPIVSKDSPAWLVLATGLELREDTKAQMQESAISIAREMKKRQETKSFDTKELEVW